MTQNRSFKRIVRQRMDKTGESYTTARAALLTADENDPAGRPVFTMSDDAIRNRTGRGWEDWFELIAQGEAADETHGEIVRWLQANHGVDGWSAQSVTTNYERATRKRIVGQRYDGVFAATASKTVNVPVETLYDWVVEEANRTRWLPDGPLSERTATKPRSARYDWEDGATRVIFGFEPKGEGKSLLSLEHERLSDGDEIERLKLFWLDRLATLKEVAEG